MSGEKFRFRNVISGATFIVVGKEAADRMKQLGGWVRNDGRDRSRRGR
jgi:hypothetical protein